MEEAEIVAVLRDEKGMESCVRVLWLFVLAAKDAEGVMSQV